MSALAEIKYMTREEIKDDEIYITMSEMNDIERVKYQMELKSRAKELGIVSELNALIKAWKAKEKEMQEEERRERQYLSGGVQIKCDSKGNPLQTSENFLTILENDPYFNGIQWNELTHSPERRDEKGNITRWTDADDADARIYIEATYGLWHPNKYEDTMRKIFTANSYHPIKNNIESIKWDGVERIPYFLTKWLKCDDNEYTQEVSRLIFAGGINRLYRPGCKFDDMVVLIGKRQGEGKSTIVRWLATDDKYFREIGEIEGQRGIEALEGGWICEMSELLALTKTKEVEAVKSYITKLCDTYRRPFDRRVTEHKRQCIMIGTTNKEQFLTDKTGNRRFYPVVVNTTGYELHDNEEAIKSDIMQCWAEAKVKLDRGEMPAHANRELLPQIQEAQKYAVEDDYREEYIKDYLSRKKEICIIELWEEALGNRGSKPTKKDSNEISLMIQAVGGWARAKTAKRFSGYGVCKYFYRDLENAEVETLDDVPF